MPERFPGAAQEAAQRELGGPTSEEETVVTTGATVVQLVGNDPDAVALVAINLGANTVLLGLNQLVSASRGVRLDAGGGAMTLTLRDDFTLPAREWFAISPAGASTVYVLRLKRYRLGPG